MSTLPWTPWHKVVRLRDDVRSGELSLAIFAADLYDVVMGKARPVYQDPREFFALTYPTFNLRGLVRDVILRLAGRNEKAVHQLELTYGGGKTHALVTLQHLVSEPSKLPDLPAVHEFVQHAGIAPPPARVAVLAFDRLDPVTGVDVRGPDGSTARFKYPWTVLAYQLGGREGLRILGAEDGGEREEHPFTNVLEDLFRLPEREGRSTLILMDEVLMWARTKVGSDPIWRHRIQDFMQCLTQAATKVDRCAVVASLLATDPRKSDELGKEITQELYSVFRREREEGVQPVVKEDVAEILRRRFFTPESIRDREAFRPHVVAALKGIGELDEQTRRDGKAAEDRFLSSYPFHPDLTEVFYSKWTNLEGFQRTRGVLRTFALALRDAERWDGSPLVAANAFLSAPESPAVSEAARELTTIAETEQYEGKRQAWTAILEGELTKAREIQGEMPGVRFREVEQAVLATFLHSQPIGQKALTRELMILLGHTRPDRIELEKALRRWTEVSWFLDEAAIADVDPGAGGQKQLPKSWRLGSKPNLRQMHHEARARVASDLVDVRLRDEIGKVKSLTAGAAVAGARVHALPDRPADVEDDGDFHYAVLGPRAASEPGKPSAEARRFLDETTSADRPRVNRNAVVLAVPSRDGLDLARDRIRDYLAWEDVREQLKGQALDPVRSETLAANVDTAKQKMPEAIRQAYSLVVTVSEKNVVEAFKLQMENKPLFALIKADPRTRIQETAINAEALLPEGPYDLWRAGETARWAKDLASAFAQFPHLPKMLNRQAIQATIVLGCKAGQFVLRATRPDRSVRTFWREQPDEAVFKDPSLEVVLSEAAELRPLAPELLVPGTLPGLWETPTLSVKDVCEYFSGGRVVKVQKGGYEEPIAIPRAARSVVEAAIQAAVRDGKLWLTSGPASILGEEIPAGLLADGARLQAPPQPIAVMAILPSSLPEAWSEEVTTALAIAAALSNRAGQTLPWATVRDAIDGAIRARMLERTPDSGPWPSDFATAQAVKLRVPVKAMREGPGEAKPIPPPPGALVAEADLEPGQIQELADQIADIKKAAAGLKLRCHLRIELSGPPTPPEDVVRIVNEKLKEVSADLRLT